MVSSPLLGNLVLLPVIFSHGVLQFCGKEFVLSWTDHLSQRKGLISVKVILGGPRPRYERNLPEDLPELGVELVYCPRGTSEEELLAKGRDAFAYFVDAITPVTESLMREMPNLRLIHSEGVAYNAIDCEAARRRGIYVCHSKGCNAAAVAEQTIMLILMLTRLGITGHRAVVEGRQIQLKEEVMFAAIPELGDHTVGFVGFGDTVQATMRRLHPFGCPLYYYAPHRRPPDVEQAFHTSYLPLEELAATCDIVVLLCAVNDQTRGMVNDQFLSRMKPTAYLVNTGRGDLIDNNAVRRALVEGRLAGAAFDVLDPEPTPADHPLVDLPEEVRDRVVYSPHLAGITGSSFRRSHTGMWNSLRLLLNGQRPNHVVNGMPNESKINHGSCEFFSRFSQD